ncbi:type VII toxin-antitoxin system HepT family RNase toxin [Rubrivirga sp.]|uniref:type VII toxin-antitoxin system HepT family RNase toxin n=1 Tax=Rubrivirga sp. TaxID=1885344 RepID=UPI003C739614
MADDVVLNKAAVIGRCVARVREESGLDPALEDVTRQDSVVLNLQRACQAAIDLAMRACRMDGLGIPQDSRDAFRLLIEADVLPEPLGASMRSMVGFRNVAVHDYQTLSLPIVRAIVRGHLGDLEAFAAWALRR